MHLPERRVRAAADHARLRAPAARQCGCDRVVQPILEGDVVAHVHVSDRRANYVAIIEHDVIKRAGPVSVLVDMDFAAAILPGQVGHLAQRARLGRTGQVLHQLADRLFGRVAADHVVDEGIADQLLVEISGREASENDRRIGMVLFHHFGDVQRAVRVGQPVQVDAERGRVKSLDQGFRIEVLIVQHAHGQVDDAHPQSMSFEVLGHRGKPDGVHLEHRSRGHQVAHRAIKNRMFAEVVHTGGV